ncbi:MAG TPA: sugar ABC transporter ATP-binding protein [Anaerohalosphaeraceae bacterium]|jgi:ribose transport system ATP-binding protein|nr:sugar ABC transporter ATP-binding protein [Anaerohalosphaeraceae bacterium]HRT51493.1 sugar ABC transporter ATP-binding protein [Anaerohalosphaeraceae bacterium]HRT87172.1 sugar ABC transporter ATP-binding protein [Anaerohalosphaeraceae bacterium]
MNDGGHDSGGETVALRMTGISKRFGPVQALSDVTFTARKGTVHALVGENGAGKSTLMKILAGVHQPDAGQIEIHGETMVFANPGQAIEAGISMIYQELDLAEDLTVAANVFLGIELHGRLPWTIDHKRMAEETQALADRFNFDIDATATVAELSTGDCQIVEVLKALMRKASIIVMDEPTSSLSEREAARLFEIVRDLRGRGYTIIYISHRLEEIVDLADDISVLRDGYVVHTGSAANLAIPQIVHHMVGRELKDFYPARQVEIGEVLFKAQGISSAAGIEDISFEVRAGEIVGMAGLVGAGRTEVARAIFGVDGQTGGTLHLGGEQLAIASPADAITAGIAYLTEDRKRTGLCLELPCSWNVTLPNLCAIGMKYVISPGRETQIARQYGSKISLKWASPTAPADSLSGGNQQKVLIARWLLAESKFLIVDEPTRGIDVGAKKEIYTLLNDLAGQGKGILFISSELPELFGITDRILVMRRGRLVGNLKTKDTSPDWVMHLAAVEEN